MPANHGPIYLDTCAVIAAHAAGCWNVLTGMYDLHTVQECVKELGGGNHRDPKYVPVDVGALVKLVAVHAPSQKDLVGASLASPNFAALDAGERELLAWCAYHDPRGLWIITGDKAAAIAACQLGLQDRLCSLDELIAAAGKPAKLPDNFTKKWLTSVKTDYLLEALK